MKFEKVIRTAAVVMGVGVAMLMVKPAAAQEDIAPTPYEEVGMVRMDQPVDATPSTRVATLPTQAQ